jgi:phosphate transport system permease protein
MADTALAPDDATMTGPLHALQRPRTRADLLLEEVLRTGTACAAMVVLVVLGLMLADTTRTAAPVFRGHSIELLSGRDWQPAVGAFGGLSFVYGTLVTSAIALLLAVPASIGVALFLSELAPRRVRTLLVTVVDALAAVPSVVFGLWGVFVLVPFLGAHAWGPISSAFGGVPIFAGPATGRSLATAGLLLAIMAVPIITAITREVVSTVPTSQREAALALGATRWEVVRTVVLPHSRAGIIGAVMLGFGRAVGETIAVALVVGSAAVVDPSLFHPGYSMASVIANEFPEATGVHIEALVAVGVVLFLLTLVINVAARGLVWRGERRRA